MAFGQNDFKRSPISICKTKIIHDDPIPYKEGFLNSNALGDNIVVIRPATKWETFERLS